MLATTPSAARLEAAHNAAAPASVAFWGSNQRMPYEREDGLQPATFPSAHGASQVANNCQDIAAPQMAVGGRDAARDAGGGAPLRHPGLGLQGRLQLLPGVLGRPEVVLCQRALLGLRARTPTVGISVQHCLHSSRYTYCQHKPADSKPLSSGCRVAQCRCCYWDT